MITSESLTERGMIDFTKLTPEELTEHHNKVKYANKLLQDLIDIVPEHFSNEEIEQHLT
jgi:hypothetical protein